jgi:hypothetical protein
MISLRRRTVRVLTSAALLSSGLGLLALVNASSAAHADPSYEISGQPFVGVGSDTLQDLFNAFSGAEPSEGIQPGNAPNLPTVFYTPIHSSGTDGSGSETIASFDALNPHKPFANPPTGDFITTKLNGPTFDRPNGATDGRVALDDAINGLSWSNVNGPASSVKGYIDFARSTGVGSSAVAGSVPISDLSYIPFASDGNAYAYHCANPGSADCTTLANLPSSVFKALYTGNGILAPASWGASTDTLEACALYSGSGMFSSFLKQANTGQTTTGANTALTATGGSNCTELEQNNLDAFLSASPGPGAALANTDWVEPVSVGNVTGQHNGVALDRSNNFWNTNGTDIVGNGIAAPSDAFNTTVENAGGIGAGATSITIGLQAPVGSTLTLDAGNPSLKENVTVSAVTGTDPYTVTVSPTTFAHASGASVTIQFAHPYNGDGTATWSPNTAYFASNFGRWLFVVVPSAEITGRGEVQGLADLFYSPSATGGTAAVCTAAAKTTVSLFGFDPSLPDNGSSHQQGGTCGTVAFTGTN